MMKMKSFGGAMFGIVFMALSGTAMAHTHVNGHRPSDHTLDSTNHPYEALVTEADARQSATSGFAIISPRDRELQRIDDIKRRTTDGYMLNTGPSGLRPVIR